jgi:GDP-L-fucose synthase
MNKLNPQPKIYIAGHRGMVGSAIVRQLQSDPHNTYNLILKTHSELDLTDQAAVREFFEQEKPDQV